MFQGKTVFRGGFGIYHGAAQNDDLNAGFESDTFRVSVLPPQSDRVPDCCRCNLLYEQTAPDFSTIPSTNRRTTPAVYSAEDGATYTLKPGA